MVLNGGQPFISNDFLQKELDTVLLYAYDKENGFTTPIDSIQSYSSSRLSMALSIERTYKFELFRVAAAYRFHGFEARKEGYNENFHHRSKTDLFAQLNAYKVNGVRKLGAKIEIEK